MENKRILGKIIAVIPGLAVIVLTLYVLRTYVEPWMGSAVIFGQKGWMVKVLHLNYILLSIIVGMLYRNVVIDGRIPGWAEEGFRTTRLFINTGVIMLGCLYTIQSPAKVDGIAILLILSFVFGTIFLVMFIGRWLGMDRSMIGTMGAASGVCRVSAAIATSTAVKARPSYVALAIATILGFGVVTMFISPFIGKMLGLSDYQFGAWVGRAFSTPGRPWPPAWLSIPPSRPAPPLLTAKFGMWCGSSASLS